MIDKRFWMAGALGLAVAACNPQGPEPQATGSDAGATVEEDEAVGGALADNAGEAGEPQHTKSILRPEVIQTEEPAPVIEPVRAVIPFGDSRWKLSDDARKVLDDVLASPVARLGGPVMLRGHSDSRGSDGDNRVASRKRAEAVRDYLTDHGVDAARIRIIALGETRPIAPNAHEDGTDDPEGRARNRRVDIEIALPPAPERPAAPGDEGPTDPAASS